MEGHGAEKRQRNKTGGKENREMKGKYRVGENRR
jgi:hypothetical protein